MLFFSYSSAQTPCDSTLVISGWVFSSEGDVVPASMAVNRNSGGGAFVELDGSFLLRACPGDTLVFGAIGYYSVALTFIFNLKNILTPVWTVIVYSHESPPKFKTIVEINAFSGDIVTEPYSENLNA